MARTFPGRFHAQVGLPPKVYARIAKFHGFVEELKGRATADWSALALDWGYYDQAHLIRDFHAFSGATPAEFLRTRWPDGGSVVVG